MKCDLLISLYIVFIFLHLQTFTYERRFTEMRTMVVAHVVDLTRDLLNETYI